VPVNILLVDQEEMVAVLVLMVTTEELDTTSNRKVTTVGGDLSEVAMASSLFNTKSLKEV
jgi:hypothetical protein